MMPGKGLDSIVVKLSFWRSACSIWTGSFVKSTHEQHERMHVCSISYIYMYMYMYMYIEKHKLLWKNQKKIINDACIYIYILYTQQYKAEFIAGIKIIDESTFLVRLHYVLKYFVWPSHNHTNSCIMMQNLLNQTFHHSTPMVSRSLSLYMYIYIYICVMCIDIYIYIYCAKYCK